MTGSDNWGNNCFYCEECGKAFRSPLYSISRGVERSHFFEDPRMPEVEVTRAEEIGSYCSQDCLDKSRTNVLRQEAVTATYPGIGPIECCTRCGGPVDMTKFHRAWTEEEVICDWSDEALCAMQPINVQVLAVVCQNCGSTSKSIKFAVEEKSEDPIFR